MEVLDVMIIDFLAFLSVAVICSFVGFHKVVNEVILDIDIFTVCDPMHNICIIYDAPVLIFQLS